MVHDAGAASVGQKFRTVAEQSARRDFVKQSYHSLPRVLHLQHRRPAWPQLFNDDAEEFFGNIDGQLLIGLESLASWTCARDHTRTRNLELVAFAAHRLHQNRQMQLSTPADSPGVGRFSVFHA